MSSLMRFLETIFRSMCAKCKRQVELYAPGQKWPEEQDGPHLCYECDTNPKKAANPWTPEYKRFMYNMTNRKDF